MTLDISVIVNSYQQAATLDLCLTALAHQDFTGTWEVLVVDDGSADATADVARRHADQSRIDLAYLRLADHGNRWSYARNLGAQVARGQTLLFFDADMVPARDVVRLHVEEQGKQPGLLAGSRLWRNPDRDLGPVGTTEQQLQRLAHSTESNDPVARKRELSEVRWRFDLIAGPHPWRAWFGCHSSVPNRPDARYDETMLGWGPADIELACRLHRSAGLPVRYLHQVRAWHLEHPSAFHNPFRTGSDAATTEYVRQICYMIQKYPAIDMGGFIAMGFDRLAQNPDGTWRTVPRGEGAPVQETLRQALDWYSINAAA